MAHAHTELEDPNTKSIEIARLWEKAYTELVEFEDGVLRQLRELMPKLSATARHEAELTNMPMIVQHLQTFKYRRQFWQQRRRELDGG